MYFSKCNIGSNLLTFHLQSIFYNYCNPIFCIREVVGKILFLTVSFLIIFQFLVFVLIVVPYEASFQSIWISYILVAIYFLINIVYHYIKARTTNPGKPAKSLQEPICYVCKNHKPPNAHHCRICDQCVVDMDHHCIWINNCVGAGNLRHFVQFIGFTCVGNMVYMWSSFRAYKNHHWEMSDLMYCNMNLSDWPWTEYFCSISPTVVSSCIGFSFVIACIMFLFLGSLFLSTFVMVSHNVRYIQILKTRHPPGDCWTMYTSWKKDDFWDTWKDILGLRRGRTFWHHVLLPSGHRTNISLDWDDDEYQKVPLLVV